MYSYFQKLIDQGFALVYIDNILLLAHIKIHMLDLIEQLHQISSSNILKISPEKSFCYLLTVKFLGLAIGNKTIKPISSKFDGIHKLETPTSRTELMRFIGSLKFYSNFMNKLHLSLEPFCTPSFITLYPLNGFQKWTNSLWKLKLLFQKSLHCNFKYHSFILY